MQLNKNKKFLAIIASLMILNTTSIIILHRIVNIPDNNPLSFIIKNPMQGQTLSGTITISFTATDRQRITEKQI